MTFARNKRFDYLTFVELLAAGANRIRAPRSRHRRRSRRPSSGTRAPGSGTPTSTARRGPCEQHLARSGRLGHVGRLGTELDALEQGKGMRGLTEALAWQERCSFVVESVERRMDSAALYR